jgi:hypothetical protein
MKSFHDFRLAMNRRQAIGTIAGGVTFSSGASWDALGQTGIRVLRSPEDLARSYDYVILGAGSAGCVLAHRLAQVRQVFFQNLHAASSSRTRGQASLPFSSISGRYLGLNHLASASW